MKDLHNHLLYGIDDGSIDKEMSIKILKNLENSGVTDVLVTPHYIIGTSYSSNNQEKNEILSELQKNTNIKLYLGNEIYIDNNIINYIKDKEISTINNTKYVLIELPLNSKLDSCFDILFELICKDYIPVIAHPERYLYLNNEDYNKMLDMGCLFQANITSLCDKYGKDVRKRLIKLLKNNMIHVLGTDTHRDYKYDLNKGLNTLKKIVNNNIYNDLLYNNFDKIINNLDI